ncbi:DUF3570 domain-containing protein [Aliikangiella sp. IMCC44653]
MAVTRKIAIFLNCKVLFKVIFLFSWLPIVESAVLPEDRSDALYHYYEGGGVDIQGPSILLRKSIKDTVSISANYYVDNVSSASIDVVTTASAYTERRVEKSLGIDYLHDKTTMSLNYTASDENDFSARSAHFGISQDFFGDLTTLNLGFSQGWDDVGKREDESFAAEAKRRHFRVGVSQILTKNSLINLSLETITDQGYLNNPYRSVRYLVSPTEYARQEELYPETRTSDSVAIRGMYYLPYRASLKLEYKRFADTWGIEADTIETGYVHPLGDEWMFDFKLRHYAQTKANFYSDLFSQIDAQNFRARDKEMSTFNANAFGFGIAYTKELKGWELLDKFTANVSFDRIYFDFEDFKDLRVEVDTPGDEPLYSYNANVIRIYFSVFY